MSSGRTSATRSNLRLITTRVACAIRRRALPLRCRAAARSPPARAWRRGRRCGAVHAAAHRHCCAAVRETTLACATDVARRSRRPAARRERPTAIHETALGINGSEGMRHAWRANCDTRQHSSASLFGEPCTSRSIRRRMCLKTRSACGWRARTTAGGSVRTWARGPPAATEAQS